MVGEDVDNDVLGAGAAGLKACLVRTGKFHPGDELKLQGTKHTCMRDLEQLVDSLALSP
jgi:ribonucleotide monophosphatase NagD (HAD superfamily)